MAKKSFLRSMIEFVSGKYDARKKLSAENAAVLQLKYQDSFTGRKKRENYPPYLDIVSQLSAEKPEIFRAAVYYLRKIAENENRYCEPICEILQKYAASIQRGTDDVAYLSEQIQKLEQKNHCLPK